MTTPNTTFIPLEAANAAPGCSEPRLVPSGYVTAAPQLPTESRALAVMLTRRCNMSCAHCSVESGPKVKGEPTVEELSRIVADAARCGVRTILLTGGEPMLRPDTVRLMTEQCRAAGIAVSMTSNGFWGKTPDSARVTLESLILAGLGHLTISYDRYHAAFMGPGPVVNIARAAEMQGLSLFINITRTAQDADLSAIVAPFEGLGYAELRFYDVQPLGRARHMEMDGLRGELEGFCNACSAPAVTDDGRVTACNGPSYFAPLHSSLQLGSLREASLDQLLVRHGNDPILETIRTFGPSRLRDELAGLPGFENFARSDYRGMCDLCLHLTSDAAAVEALETHLNQPKFIAARAAARAAIGMERRDGLLKREYVNTVGAARYFLRAALEPATDDESHDRVLGRADLDWTAQLECLGMCGMAGVLAPAMSAAPMTRWAPNFFREGIRNHAMKIGMLALIQREVMREVARALREVGTRGVLLKGGAMLALSLENKVGTLPTRSCCDLDIYIAPDKASAVRALLLGRGFHEFESPATDSGDNVENLHQLHPLIFRGVPLEIHQTLLPGFCGLPEREMLADTRALADPELSGLEVMSAEAMFLHSCLHAAKHLFLYGLKTAWDFLWILDHSNDFDWAKLERWVGKTTMRRGFWVVARVLNRELDLKLPVGFMEGAPSDERQTKLEALAARSLFDKLHADCEDQPLVCQSIYLLLIDSWWHRARHVGSLALSKTGRKTRRERAVATPGYQRGRRGRIRAAAGQWKRLA